MRVLRLFENEFGAQAQRNISLGSADMIHTLSLLDESAYGGFSFLNIKIYQNTKLSLK